jgi:hypothetical protein
MRLSFNLSSHVWYREWVRLSRVAGTLVVSFWVARILGDTGVLKTPVELRQN